MDAKRVREIEEELQAKMPHSGDYDEDADALTMILCNFCNGAIDDHKYGCVVPLVYELLDDVKSNAWGLATGPSRVHEQIHGKLSDA